MVYIWSDSKGIFLFWRVDNVAPLRNKFLNENASARHSLSPYELLIRNPPYAPRQSRLLPLFLVAHQILDDFLLKNPHNLNPGHKDVLTREYSPWWLAFTVQENPIQDTEGEESWTVLLPSCEHFTLHIYQAGYAHWYDCGMTVLGDNQLLADWIWDLLHGRNTCPVVLTCLHSCIWSGHGL